jgi:hypothetical protein
MVGDKSPILAFDVIFCAFDLGGALATPYVPLSPSEPFRAL